MLFTLGQGFQNFKICIHDWKKFIYIYGTHYNIFIMYHKITKLER